MLSDVCPQCGTPLFKLKDEIFCAKCNKPVVMVGATEEETRLVGDRVLGGLEQTVLAKIQEMSNIIKQEKEPEKLQQLGNVIFGWLTLLEKLRSVREAKS